MVTSQVEDAVDEDTEQALSLGLKIRATRKTRGLTIQQLAERSHVSRSLISQVERGRATPSLTTLRRVANVLEIPLAMLFWRPDDLLGDDDDDSDANGRQLVVRESQRKRLHVHGPNIDYRLLTPDSDHTVEFVWCELAPGASVPEEPDGFVSHAGEENVVCIDGILAWVIAGKRLVLNRGDSISFACAEPHRIENGSRAERAVFVAAISPPTF